MHCPFDVLHFLPLALIVAAFVVAKSKLAPKALSTIIAGLSVVGLTAGAHVHTVHAEHMSLIDPCYGYMISLVVAVYTIVKSSVAVKAVR